MISQVLNGLPRCLIPVTEQRRCLNVHENVSFTLMESNGVPVPKFGVAKTPDEALEIAKSLQVTGRRQFVNRMFVLFSTFHVKKPLDFFNHARIVTHSHRTTDTRSYRCEVFVPFFHL
jgi:hypothetical protein